MTIGYDDLKLARQTDNLDPEKLSWQGSFKVKEAYTIDGKRMSGSGWLQIFSPKNDPDLVLIPRSNDCTTHGNPTIKDRQMPVLKNCSDIGKRNHCHHLLW